MAFIFFRPVFWLIVCWTFVYIYYADAGLAFDGVDKEYRMRQLKNSNRTTTTEKWPDKDASSSSHSIFQHGNNVTWMNKFQLLLVMLISSGIITVGSLAFSSSMRMRDHENDQ